MDHINQPNHLSSLLFGAGGAGKGHASPEGMISPESLLDSSWSLSDAGTPLPQETRQQMSQLILGGSSSPLLRKTPALGTSIPSPGAHPPLPTSLSAWAPTFVTLVTRIRQELESNLTKLLALNPSRREAVAQHLDRLAGHAPAPSASAGAGDAAGGLRRWVDGPRSPAQNAAMQAFFEEVARICLGQAMLLKAWSDRGLRPWKEEDLGQLNWALSSALKPHVPLDRESWQITRPNLYSWYNPGPALQREIWLAFDQLRISDEGPSLISGLLRMSSNESGRSSTGYDERFFSTLWEQMSQFGFNASPDTDPLRRKKSVFSPTLRDGSMVKTGPVHLNWIGLEAQPFLLLQAELVQLWWGPSVPPLWAIGTGLEVHSRDQLSLALSSPKPSLLSRISEMEACDLAFVLEEKAIHTHGRSTESASLRELLDSLPYFKKLRSPGTSLGNLQACVALSKLRPGGLLWWAREQPLSASDGMPMLNFVLDRARLLCEWDFSEVSHSLPISKPMFPRRLYLFARDPDLQSRLSHRPTKISLQGQIRSHVEMPLFLGDALQAFRKNGTSMRGPWQAHSHTSPTTQKEWSEHWPDPTATDLIQSIEELRQKSSPLANVGTIRATPAGDPARNGAWTIHPSLKGLWIQAESHRGNRRLVASELPRPGTEAKGSGYLVLVSDETWISPLRAYLESECVQKWMEYHSERKGDRWVLSEQVVRYIPVPQELLRALGAMPDPGSEQAFALPLPGDWERLASEVIYHPRTVLERLSKLPHDEEGQRIRAKLFVRSTRARDQLHQSQARLLSLVNEDGRIQWRDLLDILPASESIALTLHPMVRLSGSLPGHLPIVRIEQVRVPMNGILFATESGFHLHLGAESQVILDMIWNQLQGVSHPTWSELIQFIRLPRSLEIADATAQDVLRSHGEQMARLKDLSELISACSNF